MIRSPSGSPACWIVRSASAGRTRPSPSSGPVSSVSVCGAAISGCDGCRSAVDRYAGKSSAGRAAARPRTPAAGSARPCRLRLVRALDRPPHVRAQPRELLQLLGRDLVARSRQRDLQRLAHPGRRRREDDDPVAQVDRLVDVVRDEDDRDVVVAAGPAARGPRDRRASARRRTRTARPSAGPGAGRRARGRSPRAAACRRRAATGSGRPRRRARRRPGRPRRGAPSPACRACAATAGRRRSGGRTSTGTASGCTPGTRAPSCQAARRPGRPRAGSRRRSARAGRPRT